MAGEYDRFNQAVLSEKDLIQQEEKADKIISEEKSKLKDARLSVNKKSRQQVLQKGNVDKENLLDAKDQLAKREKQIAAIDDPLEKQRKKIDRAKSRVKTAAQLEKQGYKKETRGNKIIYFKEDNYERKEGDERKYREEEYIFDKKTKKPVKFVRRDEGRRENSDKRFIFDERTVEFSNGIVKRVEERDEFEGSDEYDKWEVYDSKGRTRKIKYYDDGEFEKEEDFRYEDGQVTVETDTAEAKAARKARRKAEDKFWKNYNEAYWKAKDQGIDIQIDGDKNKTLQQKADEFNKQYKEGLQEKREINEIRLKTDQDTGTQTIKYFNNDDELLKTVTKTPKTPKNQLPSNSNQNPRRELTAEEVLTQGSPNFNTGVPGVNQGTTTKNIPKQDVQFEVSSNENQKSMNMIGPEQRPSNEEVVRAIEYETAGPVKKFFMTDFDEKSDREFDKQQRAYSQGRNNYDALAAGSGYALANFGQQSALFVKDFATSPIDTTVSTVKGIPEIPGNIASTAKNNPVQLVTEVAAGFGVSGAASKGITAARRARTRVDPIEFDSESRVIETSPNNQGLGYQQTRIRGKADVTEGLIFRRTRRVDVDAEANLDKQTRAFGTPDPEVSVVRNNEVSTEFGATDILEGPMKVRVSDSKKTRTRKVDVDAVRQQNNQITNIDGTTTFSRTDKVGKLNDETIYRTETFNPKTQDVAVSLSKNQKAKPTQLPTDDIYAQASKSQTDVFYNRRDVRSSPERVIDTEATNTPTYKKPQISQSPLSLQEQRSSPANIEALGTAPAYSSSEIKVIDLSKADDPIESKRSSGGYQQQVFEQPSFDEQQSSRSITPVQRSNVRKSEFDFDSQSSPGNIDIPSNVLKDVVNQGSKTRFAPGFSFSRDDSLSMAEGSQFGAVNSQSKKPAQQPGFENSFKFDSNQAKMPGIASVSGFSFKSAQKPANKQQYSNPFKNPDPTPTPVTPPVTYTGPPKRTPNLDFDPQNSKSKKKSQRYTSQDGGQYISSLGGLILDKSTKNPQKKLTGLELRGIKIR